MLTWTYTILTDSGKIMTKNSEYAEKKSRLGNIVFCKRQSNYFKFNYQN